MSHVRQNFVRYLSGGAREGSRKSESTEDPGPRQNGNSECHTLIFIQNQTLATHRFKFSTVPIDSLILSSLHFTSLHRLLHQTMQTKTKTNSPVPVPVLLDLVKSQQWEEVIRRCKIATRKEFLCQDSTNFKQTPLHLALRFKAPIEVIRSFVDHEYFNKAMEMKDTYCGYQPLHSAVRYRATSSVISLLILAFANNHMQSKSNGSFLLEQHDCNGTNPLHIACIFGSPLDTIQVLVRANPLILNMTTSKGKSVLFLATECSRIGPETIAYILGQNSCISTCNDTDFDTYRGFTPLHMACIHDGPLEVISLLVQSDPSACFQKTPSKSNQTPLGLYFAHSSTACREIVKLLLGPMDGNDFGCGCRDENDCGVIHRVLRFPQDVPDLLEYVLRVFPADVEKL